MSGSQNHKPQKPQSPGLLARQPRGFADRGPADIAATERMLAHIREVYTLYGFDALETPFIEYTDALGKFLPDQDRPNEGVFSFQDDDEQWLSLRYDLTAPLARHVAENYDTLPKPFRSYRAGWVFRNEKPGPGRFRQFMQFDADTVGAPSVSADAEICMMAADTLEKVGIARGDYAVKINNRKVLDGVLEAIGLSDDAHAARRLVVLRAIDKLDRLGAEGVALLLGEGRKDESGDFTKGAGLDADQIARVLAFTQARGTDAASTLANLEKVVEGSARGIEGVAELREIAALVAAAGYDDGRVQIDPAVVRGLEYYTGPVYEAELTFTIAGDDGQPVRFGSVAGGGRYDGLVARFRGEAVPATGFSIGVSRLLAALKIIDSPIARDTDHVGPVVVLVLDRGEIAHYHGLVSRLRGAGIRAELYLGGAGMRAQMKYADRRNSPCVVIQGSDERAQGTVQIKDLVAGAEQADAARELDNAAYKAQRLAQFSVPEADLVEAVRGVLGARQG
ncbi:histidyl-tRNA synthetase [Pseudochelatococcus lubricantis]|uniref:Histidine--tRNA ligase n=1 Tax=Pseudochelatococcus lubricantis TaxID=1538102 RepID=A0ABX0V6X3_9HYPH|nr:histidine--tRNA ligase [Pseudochelatococcus lubricantis]NIJ59530.1 histidyl-tRNA synthetase [Pseudochelatococcus lubricantis]